MMLRSQPASMNKNPAVFLFTAARTIVVHFTGYNVLIDREKLERIRDELLSLAEEHSASDLYLDFGNVEYLTSETLGSLVRLHKELLARDQHMTVVNLHPQIHEVFVVAGLQKFLNLRLREPEADPMPWRCSSIFRTGDQFAEDETVVRQDRWIEIP